MVERHLITAERLLTGLLATAAMALAVWQVLGRYLAPSLVPRSAEEMVIYLIVWAALISCASLVADDGHVRADLLLRLVPAGRRRWIEAMNVTGCLILCAVLVWYGGSITVDARVTGETSLTGLHFPMWIYYLSLPVSAGLMGLHYAVRLARLLGRDGDAVVSFDHGRE